MYWLSRDRFLYFALCWLFISNLFISADCPMSEWSVWSQCSCESQRQQRYRVALVPVTRGQQCTPVETQSRSCSLSECGGEWIPVVKVLWSVRHLYKKKNLSSFSQLSYWFCLVPENKRLLLLLRLLLFTDCQAPFVYSNCGSPCEKQCALQGRDDVCPGVRECVPGCYCPQVNHFEACTIWMISLRMC